MCVCGHSIIDLFTKDVFQGDQIIGFPATEKRIISVKYRGLVLSPMCHALWGGGGGGGGSLKFHITH